LASDGAVAVVGTAGGTVLARSGFGGVRFPSGALGGDVIVVIERLANPTSPGAGPLPTALHQYPFYYEFSTTPSLTSFAVPVAVGLCHLEVGDPLGPPSAIVANRLRVAHPSHTNPATIELLPPASAQFVNCPGGNSANPPLGGVTTSFSPFALVDPGTNFVAVSVGERHACGLDDTGQAWCWGTNTSGQLGDGSLVSRSVPAPAGGAIRFTHLSAGGNHTCGIATTGTLYCWGSNVLGELGIGNTTNSTGPAVVAGSIAFRSVSLSLFHTCAVSTANAAYCWGGDQWGALGTTIPVTTCSTMPCATTPQPVLGGIAFSDVSVGLENTCGVSVSGAGFCWGADQQGQLGDGQPTTGTCPTAQVVVRCVTAPTPVAGSLTFTSISTGSLFACGLTAGGAAYCWGDGRVGQRGDGTQASSNTPIAVAGGSLFTIVRAEGENATLDHACALTPGQTAFCWGSNITGQLGAVASTAPCGTPTGTCSLTPLAVSGGNLYSDIDTGFQFTCAVSTSGKIYCWGFNVGGQLGDGTTIDRSTPTQIAMP